MSGSIKKEIRARYVEYVVLYAMFSWPICHLTKPSYRYIPTANAYLGGTIFANNYLEAITLLSGFFIAASRMRDRLLQQKTRNVFMRMTCRKHRTNKIPINAATLNTFLTTSLNTELVVTILKGITVLAAGSSDSADNMMTTTFPMVMLTNMTTLTNMHMPMMRMTAMMTTILMPMLKIGMMPMTSVLMNMMIKTHIVN
jgi:hypothetical protein